MGYFLYIKFPDKFSKIPISSNTKKSCYANLTSQNEQTSYKKHVTCKVIMEEEIDQFT